MLSYEFKTYIANGYERYGYVARSADRDALTTRSARA